MTRPDNTALRIAREARLNATAAAAAAIAGLLLSGLLLAAGVINASGPDPDELLSALLITGGLLLVFLLGRHLPFAVYEHQRCARQHRYYRAQARLAGRGRRGPLLGVVLPRGAKDAGCCVDDQCACRQGGQR